MLKLYTKRGCPFCGIAIEKLEELNLNYEEKNVSEDKESYDELIKFGGKFQAPFLIDEKNKVSMYESGDIIDYLQKYAKDGMIVCHTEHCQHSES